MCNDLDLSIALLADCHGITQISNTVVDLDFVVKEFLEGGDVEDFVGGGLGGVDDELSEMHGSVNAGNRAAGNQGVSTFLVILPGFCPLEGACRRALVRWVFYMGRYT